MMKFKIKENIIQLRKWEMGDLDSLVEHANDMNIAKYLTNKFPFPYTKENGEWFISFATQPEAHHIIFAIEVNGKACGGIGLHPQDDIFSQNAELGYWLGKKYWGNGIISACIPLIVDYGFKNLAIQRIFARPFSNNEGSKAVLLKSGFILEATLKGTVLKYNEVLDEHIFAVRRAK